MLSQMMDVLPITGTVFVLIGLGLILPRTGVLSASDLALLGRFVVNVALPALIFRALTTSPLGEVFDTGYLGAMLFGSLAAFAVGYALARYVARDDALASTFRGLGTACGNTGFVGYPILLMLMPKVASTALALSMIIENLVMIPLGLILAERARGVAARERGLGPRIAGRVLRNPIVISIMLGVIVSALNLPVPMIVARPVDMLANASSALSLIAIGGILAATPFRRPGGDALTVTFGKLVLHPLCVWFGLILMTLIGHAPATAELAVAVLVMASVPAMGIYPVLAQQFGQQGLASQVIVMTTGLSFVTMSLLVAVVMP